MRIQPKNWGEFQQYKDRKPQWIKFHRDLLNNYAYSSVQIGTKATAPLLWLLASEYDDGIIDAAIEEISFRIHIDVKTATKAIEELINAGFFISLDEDVQDCTEVYEIVPREEKRRDREETEKDTHLVQQIVDHLNLVTDSKYKSSSVKTKSLIRARLNDGFELEDFMQVHINKYADWNGGEYAKYLCPETLYSNKFEKYLNQKVTDYQKMKVIQEQTGTSFSEMLTPVNSDSDERMKIAKEEWHLG